MTSTLNSTSLRLTPQQREAAERRSRMTQRREELTSRIRKQKKSKYLQKKRGLPCGGTGTSAASSASGGGAIAVVAAEFKNTLEAYCPNPTPPEGLLPALENIIANTNNANHSVENPLMVLENSYENLALEFLECLRRQAVEAIANRNTVSFQSILRILVHLTSISSGDGSGSSTATSMDYYGRHPSTWSQLVVAESSQTTTTATTTTTSTSTTTTPQSIPTSPSWVEIFVQSLSSAKEVELTSLVLGNLVGDDGAARGVFRATADDFKSSMIAGLIRSVSPATPTAAWTLTNMIRNDSFSYASTYCSETLLSPSRLLAWLREPLLVTQTAWMIASLTAREERTVHYLCAHNQNPNQPECSFVSTIVQSIQNPLQGDQIVPLLQTLGNIACHAPLVTPLLTQTTPTLIPLLQHIITTTASRHPALMKVAWLAGCLLVDVGLEHHPSTTVAAPALIPAIINRLGGNEQSAAAFLTLEEEREFVSALWNALDVPPTADHQQGPPQNYLWTNHASRSSPVQLPFALDIPRTTLQTLVRLIKSNDSDAVLAAVHVIDLLLRRETDHNLTATLQEEELPDALERVCDSALEEAADVAAEILDDYFYNDDHSNEEVGSSPWASEPPTCAAFNFGEPSQVANGMGRGRGRGRGATIPSWMMNQQKNSS